MIHVSLQYVSIDFRRAFCNILS